MVNKKVLNENDSMDINELASLNDDISPDLIDQLQAKLSNDALALNSVDSQNEDTKIEFNENDDATLFEETKTERENQKSEVEKKEETKENKETKQKDSNKKVDLDKKFDDNFIKKYKARLNKQANTVTDEVNNGTDKNISNTTVSSDFNTDSTDITATNEKFKDNQKDSELDDDGIEELTNGNIREHKLSQKQKIYNDSLDFLDNNVKYSKYVIYIDPENVDFIESLTIKERKKLINRILREQDDISITKHRFKVINSVIKHVVVSILIISLSIPLVYNVVNFSLEATINNYRNSQNLFQALYKENGKITKKIK